MLARKDDWRQTWLDLGERETATGSQPCPGLGAGVIEAVLVRRASLGFHCMGLCHSVGRWAGR